MPKKIKLLFCIFRVCQLGVWIASFYDGNIGNILEGLVQQKRIQVLFSFSRLKKVV